MEKINLFEMQKKFEEKENELQNYNYLYEKKSNELISLERELESIQQSMKEKKKNQSQILQEIEEICVKNRNLSEENRILRSGVGHLQRNIQILESNLNMFQAQSKEMESDLKNQRIQRLKEEFQERNQTRRLLESIVIVQNSPNAQTGPKEISSPVVLKSGRGQSSPQKSRRQLKIEELELILVESRKICSSFVKKIEILEQKRMTLRLKLNMDSSC